MAMNYTPIPNDFMEEMGELSDAEYGRLIRWCQTYCITGESLELRGNERFYRKRCQMQMDRYLGHYKEVSSRRSEAGKIGGEANASRWKQKEAKGSKKRETKTNTKTNTDTNTSPTNVGRSNTPLSSPLGDRFERFWDIYPKKTGKKAALSAWMKLHPTEELTETILSAVSTQKNWPQWRKENGQYIPNPATWLNQGRWEDELPQEKATYQYDYGSLEGSL